MNHGDIVREALNFGYGGDPNYRPFYEDGITALDALLADVERLTAERDEWLTMFDGDAHEWFVSLPSPYTFKAADFTALVGAAHALESRAAAAEALAERRRAGLQAIIDYVPEGFISPMDDEDSMNYRAIARAALQPDNTEEGT